MKKFVQEFKEFAIKGNAIQLAVGVVIGAAFGAIVSSLVADIITPLISLITGSVSFSDLVWTLPGEQGVVLTYGNFLQAAIDFLITAFAIFMMVRALNKLTKKKEAEPVAPAAPTADIVLLEEILAELKKNN